jgi:hypothetical protein
VLVQKERKGHNLSVVSCADLRRAEAEICLSAAPPEKDSRFMSSRWTANQHCFPELCLCLTVKPRSLNNLLNKILIRLIFMKLECVVR